MVKYSLILSVDDFDTMTHGMDHCGRGLAEDRNDGSGSTGPTPADHGPE
jgi:hypothetical protein